MDALRALYAPHVKRLAGLVLALAVSVGMSGCGAESGSSPTSSPTSPGSAGTDGPGSAGAADRYPDIVAAELSPEGGGSWTLAVTVSSPYDSPQRYADGWRVLDPDGQELGVHTLLHDHAGEQPFTRTQTGLRIPAGVEQIIVEGRDQEYGYGGQRLTVPVPGTD